MCKLWLGWWTGLLLHKSAVCSYCIVFCVDCILAVHYSIVNSPLPNECFAYCLLGLKLLYVKICKVNVFCKMITTKKICERCSIKHYTDIFLIFLNYMNNEIQSDAIFFDEVIWSIHFVCWFWVMCHVLLMLKGERWSWRLCILLLIGLFSL